MFEGVSKTKLFGWLAFFLIMGVACVTPHYAATRCLGVIFLVVAVVLIAAIANKFNRNASYRQLPPEPQDTLESPTRDSDSDYFGPPPSLSA